MSESVPRTVDEEPGWRVQLGNLRPGLWLAVTLVAVAAVLPGCSGGNGGMPARTIDGSTLNQAAGMADSGRSNRVCSVIVGRLLSRAVGRSRS